MHVLDDDEINLKYDGILGRDVTHTGDCDILLSQNCLRIGEIYVPFAIDPFVTIPARSKQLLTVNIKNFEKKEGLINKQRMGRGIYLGNALVKNDHGRAHFYGINTNEYDVKLCLKDINLKDFTITNKQEPLDFGSDLLYDEESDTSIYHISEKIKSTRCDEIKKLIDMKNLNNEEKIHVENLIEKSDDVFILPNEPLVESGHLSASKAATLRY